MMNHSAQSSTTTDKGRPFERLFSLRIGRGLLDCLACYAAAL
jgi:hypothetical protein